MEPCSNTCLLWEKIYLINLPPPGPQKREEREKRKILEEILTYFKRKFKHISLCCEIKHTKSKKIFLMENIKEDLNQ